jgi:hypothetical protein
LRPIAKAHQECGARSHMHAVDVRYALQFRPIHQTLRTPPAIAAGVTDTLWSLEDIVRIVDEWEAEQKTKID